MSHKPVPPLGFPEVCFERGKTEMVSKMTRAECSKRHDEKGPNIDMKLFGSESTHVVIVNACLSSSNVHFVSLGR